MSNRENHVNKVQLSFESNVSLIDGSTVLDFIEIANITKIPIMAVNNLTIDERNKLIDDASISKFSLVSPAHMYNLYCDTSYNLEQAITVLRNHLLDMDSNQHIIVTRKNISGKNIDEIKRNLPTIRFQYELIGIFSETKNILKWAANDRRIDFFAVDLSSNISSIDAALCSLIKQNNKFVELSLASLLTSGDDKKFSQSLRNGKKLMKLLIQNRIPFIFSMNPKSPLHLRNGSQMRFLGELLGVSYNQTKNTVFENQFSALISNIIKLHDSSIFEGVKEGI
ncbi:MAG: RNase P subunit p30 family protein [Candidatus Heimdallarchaeaceae archaeon]